MCVSATVTVKIDVNPQAHQVGQELYFKPTASVGARFPICSFESCSCLPASTVKLV